MTNLVAGQLMHRLVVGNGDDLRHPVAMRNRDTGRIAYRLSRSGDGNKRSVALEVEDEGAAIRLVLEEGYGIRVKGPRHPTPSILYPGRNQFRVI